MINSRHFFSSKPVLALVLSVIFFSLWNLAAKEIQAEYKITKSVIYKDRALITATANVMLQPGIHSVLFTGLSTQIQENSISGKVKDANIQIKGLEILRRFHKEPISSKERALRNKLDHLITTKQKLKYQRESLVKDLNFLDKLQIHQKDKISREIGLKNAGTAEWSRILEFISTRRSNAYSSMIQTDMQIKDNYKNIKLTRSLLRQMTRKQNTVSRDVILHLNSSKPGRARISIRYVIKGPSWTPSYDIRADLKNSKVQIAYFGTVKQKTGSDWNQVRLSLSTATPGKGTSPVSSKPIYLTRGSVISSLRKTGPVTDGLTDKKSDDVKNERKKITRRISMGPTVIYQARGLHNLPSGDRPRRIPVSLDSFKANFVYVCQPRQSPHAWLKAHILNTSQNQFLTGIANIFLGNDFLGQFGMKATAPGQNFVVFMGTDERMQTKRTAILDKSSESFWGKKLVLSQGFRLSVENHSGITRTVYLKDRIPVSRDSGIEVREFQATDNVTKNEVTGELLWKFELKNNQKKNIEFGYEVVFPEEVSKIPGASKRLRKQSDMMW